MLPREVKELVSKCLGFLRTYLDPYICFEIPEFESASSNELYKNVQLHVNANDMCKVANRVVLTRIRNSKQTCSNLAEGESIVDTFEGRKLWWQHSVHKLQGESMQGRGSQEAHDRLYTLKIHKRDRDWIIPRYIDHINARAAGYKRQNREMQLYTNGKNSSMFSGGRHMWQSVPFRHPSTFDTLAMEPASIARIKGDLKSFMEGKHFFERVGRAWKRGYLLYGPPGTGKSSMIAAMANFLKYDVYDLELTQVFSNSELRQLLIQTTNRSIIVIEDIDCSINLSGQRTPKSRSRRGGKDSDRSDPFSPNELDKLKEDESSRITLSGLLNFTDGLWSCCGDERILIFTTNHIEKLDAALLRPGRMDMHIHMSYCTFAAFKILARNYLMIDTHPLFPTVESLLHEGRCKVTPAQVSEVLILDKDDPDMVMDKLIAFLQKPQETFPDQHAPADDLQSNSEAKASPLII
ncbi:unnamed protein product [Sphagnum troendelagicum]|uniref:AAA+ ATPase domain-containing protein n=1 Tax=Sphagnum jensenii TaxID=128206 RepID=A0ABP0VVK4_9BRYO